MGAGSTGGHEHPVEVELIHPFLNKLQGVCGTGIDGVLGMDYPGKGPRITDH